MRSKNKNHISYSQLLIDFIDPILDGQEDEITFLEKAKAGQIAWNFCVSDKLGVKGDQYMKAVLKNITAQHPEAKEILDPLVIRKQTLFEQYDQYILLVESREKPNGETTLYVESAPAKYLKKMGESWM